jgi:hypothetical protein
MDKGTLILKTTRSTKIIRIFILVIAVCFSREAPAAPADVDGNGFVDVLVPIALTGHAVPGAHGSLWIGIVSLFNGTEGVLDPWGGLFTIPPFGFPPGYHVITAPTVAQDRGTLFLIPPDRAGKVSFGSRVLEISKSAQPTGFEVPIVWESEFLRSAAMLLRIPTGEGVRSTLRVYDPSRTPGTAVFVEFLTDTGNVVASRILRPGDDPIVADDSVGSFRFPGFDMLLDITSLHPELDELESEHYHLRMSPLEDGMVFWGFVSVTDNDSQHVLVITPN